MPPPPSYPKRPSFFAGKFCRLMTKVALANDLGANVVCLLMVVAHQEDAAGYRGPVTWWNDQLKPLIGVRTDHALIAARKKAVEAGWLHYEPGGKGVAGRYWVTVPRLYESLDAGPTAEQQGEYGELSPAFGDRDREGIATGIGKGKPVSPAFGDRDREGIATTILPLPLPQEESPSVSGAATPPAAGKPAKPRKEPTGVHADARRAFCERWKARHGTDYEFVFGKHGKMLADMLRHVNDDLPRLIVVFDRFFADDDEYRTGGAHLFDKLRQNFNYWLAAPSPRAKPPPKTRGQMDDDDTLFHLSDLGGPET
jgi:hypothetical protein